MGIQENTIEMGHWLIEANLSYLNDNWYFSLITRFKKHVKTNLGKVLRISCSNYGLAKTTQEQHVTDQSLFYFGNLSFNLGE